MSTPVDPPTANTLWQAGRWMPALDPHAYRLDDRSTADLAHWAVGFAGLLTYFDNKNAAVPAKKGQEPPWAAFFRNDISFLLAQIGIQDPGRAYAEGLNNPKTINAAIERMVCELARWTLRAEELAVAAPTGSIEDALYGTLKRASENELAGTLPCFDRPCLERAFGAPLPGIWFDEEVRYPDRSMLFSLLNRVVGQIVDRARAYLQDSLNAKHDHPAQTGLFLAFLTLLHKNQADLNTLTERHLRFYYETVLRLQPRAALPDHAHLAFDLVPDSADLVLPKGTALIAGSASVPEPTVFLTDDSVTLNRIRIAQMRALQVTRTLRDPGARPEVQAIRAFPVVDSADGFGQPFPPDVTRWPAFGPQTGARRADAPIGVALEAEILALSQGRRGISLTLTFRASRDWTLARSVNRFEKRVSRFFKDHKVSPRLLGSYLAKTLDLRLQSGDRDVSLHKVSADLRDVADNRLTLLGHLPPEAPAITAPEGHAAPLLKLALEPDAPIYGFDLFDGATIASAQIDIAVEEMRALDLSGPFGPIDPKKPFPPFGEFPLPGDAFYLANPELTQNALTEVSLCVDWTDLPVPPDSFAKHYKDYGIDLTAGSFRVMLSRSDGAVWHPLPRTGSNDPIADASLPMFDVLPPPGDQVLAQSCYRVHRVPMRPGTPLPAAGAPQRPGALRVALIDPPEGFGQDMYPGLVTRIALTNAQKAEQSPWRFWAAKAKIVEPPDPPLLPQVAGISASYRATVQAEVPARKESPIRLFQLNPLGVPTPSRDGRMIGGRYDFDGMLQLGLAGADPPQTLTLLFDIDDLVARGWSSGDGFLSPMLSWHYFDGKRWVRLEPDAVQLDQTDGMMTHGIVRLALPANLAPGPQYPGGLMWIAIAVAGDVRRYGQVARILPQAVAATRRIDPAAPLAGTPVLPAGSVRRMATPLAQIKQVLQPYPTQGGRAAEDTRAFQQRVSERLSHKHRAITPRDYTRMVLEAFPDIAQVTCLNLSPGRVEVIVTPRRTPLRDDAALVTAPALVPLHQRLAISGFLERYSGAGAAQPMVRNPAYEPLRITASLVAGPSATSALLHQVAARLNRLIAPWLFDAKAPLPVGAARCDPSTLRARIAEMPDVAQVMTLSVVQIYRQNGAAGATLFGLKDTARGATLTGRRSILLGSAPWSVFVPDPDHDITFLGPRNGISQLSVGRDLYVTPPDNVKRFLANPTLIPTLPAPLGIGGMTIGNDFIVTDPEDVIAPPDAAISPYPLPETPLPAHSELD